MDGNKKNEVMEKQSEIFTNTVMRAFTTGGMQIAPTDKQKELVQGYFIAIDKMLSDAEQKRIQKNNGNADHKFDNNLPYIWNNINLKQLALDVMHYSKMGLDIQQKNMIHAIPFKNNRTNKYDINLMEGYNGIKFKAEKYAIDKPKNVVVELVYSSDMFKLIKKDSVHNVEGYEFQINNPFDRGEFLGGFGYYEFDDPTKNKVVFMTKKDIEKRKPEKASAEFWGGTKTEYVDGQRQQVKSDGWYEEMCLKTLKRFVYSEANLPLDPMKIDDHYLYIKERELQMEKEKVDSEINNNANKEVFDADFTEKSVMQEPKAIERESSSPTFNPATGEAIKEKILAETPKEEPKQQRQAPIGGPDF